MNKTTFNSLHQAFDAYSQHVERCFADSRASALRRQSLVKILKVHLADFPLHELTTERVASLIDYWRLRPTKRDGGRYSFHTCKKLIDELTRFFRWLDHTDDHAWRLPRGFDSIPRRVQRLSEDGCDPRKGAVYTVEELALLNRHATPMQRLVLYLSLNSGLGAAGLGRLRVTDFALDVPCPDHLNEILEPNQRCSFLRVAQHKTNVFGEWLLWDETVEIIRWGIERAQSVESERLLHTSAGKPMLRDQASNPASRIGHIFRRLVSNVRNEHPEFRHLPMISLRQLTADMVRQFGDGDVTSQFLCHSHRRFGDIRWLDDFSRLHHTLIEVRRRLDPVFDASSSILKK